MLISKQFFLSYSLDNLLCVTLLSAKLKKNKNKWIKITWILVEIEMQQNQRSHVFWDKVKWVNQNSGCKAHVLF